MGLGMEYVKFFTMNPKKNIFFFLGGGGVD